MFYADADGLIEPKSDDVMYYSSVQNGSRKVIFSAAECNLQRVGNSVIKVILASIKKDCERFSVSVKKLADAEAFIEILYHAQNGLC